MFHYIFPFSHTFLLALGSNDTGKNSQDWKTWRKPILKTGSLTSMIRPSFIFSFFSSLFPSFFLSIRRAGSLIRKPETPPLPSRNESRTAYIRWLLSLCLACAAFKSYYSFPHFPSLSLLYHAAGRRTSCRTQDRFYSGRIFFFSFQIWHLGLNINGDGSLPLRALKQTQWQAGALCGCLFGRVTLDILRLQTRGRATGEDFI